MYTKEEAIKKIEKIIDKSFEIFSEKQGQAVSKESEWQPIISVRNQLYYILEALKKENDRSRLSKINVGIYAVREFENVYDEFANMLYEVEEIKKLGSR
jgi:hypothetical protein